LLVAACAGCAAGVSDDVGLVSGTTALLQGQVISDTGGDVEYWVEYGPTTAYGSETDHATLNVEQNQPRVVVRQIVGLSRSTTYHVRVCAQDSQQQGGPRCGEDLQFTTVNVDCGDTLTANLKLSADLDCTGRGMTGLIIGAHGLNINLAGHGVIGGGGAAIANTGGYDDVTIHDGSVNSLVSGVVLDGARRNLIRNIRAGLGVPGRPGFFTSTAISVSSGEANVIRDTTMMGESSGLTVNGSTGLLVDGSEAAGRFASGIRLVADFARIHDTDFRSAQGAGLGVEGSSNRIVGNRGTGAASGGINILSGAGNVVAENELLQGFIPSFGDASGAFGDGIFVASAVTGTRLRANVANQNGGDGIEVQGPGTRLKDNTANDNTDFGIDAVAGVVDHGGNAASGNGNPLQCRNAFCQ